MSTRRLDSVVRIRALQERLAGGDVALAQGALARATAAEHSAWDQIAAAAGLEAAGSAGEMSGGEIRARQAMLARGLGHARSLGRATGAAREAVTDKVDTWHQRKQALDGIERLDDRLRSEARAEEERREMVALDDLVVMRWKRGAA